MKLVIQIPAYNEKDLLERAVEDLRQSMPYASFDQTEIVVIDDGSEDATVQRAREAKVQHIIGLEHRGLGAAFKRGLSYGLDLGADVIVNFDADLQYRAAEIEGLVRPILTAGADMVIGDRQINGLARYPALKRLSQQAGNRFISALYQAQIKDATSGFRAMSRECAQWLTARMSNNYTYTIESMCLLLKARRRISFVPIHIRETARESRLIRNKMKYIQNYLGTALKCFF